jgi:glycosyltransferase involved in cell wall biosynthesis
MQTLANAFRETRPELDLASPGRILFVSSTPNQGGIERASVRMACDLAQLSNARLSLAYACRPGSFTEALCGSSGLPTFRYVPRNSGDPVSIGALARIIKTFQPAIVHVHSRRDYLPAVLAVKLARAMGHKSALFFHCHLVRPLGEPIRTSGAFFARNVDRILAVSESVRSNLYQVHPQLNTEQVVVVPNSVGVNQVERPTDILRISVRREWGIPEEALVLGMVGRLDAKGQSFLVDIAPSLREAMEVPLRFLFVGNEGPEGFELTLRRLAAKRGASDEMILTGVQEAVGPFLAAMDILVHLPDDEAFGLAIAEAMAARLPVVASLAPGCREIVQDGETGYLVEARDKPRLAEAIVKLGGSPSLRGRMGIEGQRHVRERYSTESQIASLIGLYAERIAASPLRTR